MLSQNTPARAMIVEREHIIADSVIRSSTDQWFRGYGMMLRFFITMAIRSTPQTRKVLAVNPQWIENEKSKHKENYEATKHTDPTFPSFISTNDILTSWLFRASHTHVGFMAMNHRNRFHLATEQHAGNYEAIIAYQQQDFAIPELIRRSIPIRTRVHEEIPLPGIWDIVWKKFFLVTSWVSFYEEIVLSSPNTKHIYLVPVNQWSPNELLFEKAVIFCPKKGEVGILSFAVDHNGLCPPNS
jgi:hypothetical protein